MKQYTVFRMGNCQYYVYLFDNGHLEARMKMNKDDLGIYTSVIEADGYQRAYFVPWYAQEEDLARLRYKRAITKRHEAECYPLKVDDESAGQFIGFIGGEESV